MLRELLTNATVRVNVEVKNWEDAIRKGGELLTQDGAAEQSYVDAMVDSVKKFGPYMVIAPGIAMPHARPDAGAKRLGMSLLTLKNPVEFGNKVNDPVYIVVCLAATDHTTHICVMRELVGILADSKKMDKIRSAKNLEEVLCLLQE
jgi:mannitol/fructose-specific phosphotransferase system IIA component (Ntr-type)